MRCSAGRRAQGHEREKVEAAEREQEFQRVQVEKDRLSVEARQEAERINELVQAEQAVRSCPSSSSAASSSV